MSVQPRGRAGDKGKGVGHSGARGGEKGEAGAGREEDSQQRPRGRSRRKGKVGGGDTGSEDGGGVTGGEGETNAEEKEKRSKVEEKEEKEGCEREARVDTGGSKVKEEEKGTRRMEGGDR